MTQKLSPRSRRGVLLILNSALSQTENHSALSVRRRWNLLAVDWHNLILARFTHRATRHRLSGFISARSPPVRPAEQSGVKWQSSDVVKNLAQHSFLSCDYSMCSVEQPSQAGTPARQSIQVFNLCLKKKRKRMHYSPSGYAAEFKHKAKNALVKDCAQQKHALCHCKRFWWRPEFNGDTPVVLNLQYTQLSNMTCLLRELHQRTSESN